MNRYFVVIWLLLTSYCPVFGQALIGYTLQKKNSQTELSFQNESNLIVIPLILNGKGPHNFILDTGSESGIIFDKTAIPFDNFDKERTVPIYTGDGEKVTDLLIAHNLEIEFKGVQGNNQSMLVLNEDDLDIQNALGVEALGVLGSEIFTRFVVEVNYEKETIRLYEPRSFKVPKKYKKVDIELIDSKPFISLKVKQKGMKAVDVNLLIDTGASSALFLDAENNEELVLPEKTIQHTIGSGLTGNIYGKVGRTQNIKFGGFKFKKVITSYPEDWDVRKELTDKEDKLIRYGTIGSDVLSRFTVIYDYFNEAIYLKKNNTYKDPFKFNTMGLRVIAKGELFDEFFINEILPNSPATKVDLQVGDEIIAINGRPVFYYKYSEINAILRAAPRTKTTIIIRRKGELIKKVVKHKKMI